VNHNTLDLPAEQRESAFLRMLELLPLTARRRPAFKSRRRQREFDIIVRAVRDLLATRAHASRILEFGCGPAGGAPLLQSIGDLVESDVSQHPSLRLPRGVPFVVCGIEDAPFPSGTFDLIVSNHVIEHVDDLTAGLQEAARIARPDALFAFAVPTSVWLLLTVPGQLWRKLENVMQRLWGRQQSETLSAAVSPRHEASGRLARILGKFTLHGHGRWPQFLPCLSAFRVARWRKLLRDHGFEIIREERVLCYGSSHWPVIPTNRALAHLGLDSSHLFILRRAAALDHPTAE
jgi:SAM-dependent methyltransferase